MYVPPNNIYFRLVGKASNQAIYSSDKKEPSVWSAAVADSDDQFFTLLYDANARPNAYAIKGKESGKVLYSRDHAEPEGVGHSLGDGAYDDDWFNFEVVQVEPAYPSTFRVVCPVNNTALYSRATGDPEFGNGPSTGDLRDEQSFNYIFEDTDVVKVEFDLANVKPNGSRVKIATRDATNPSTDKPLKAVLSFNESVDDVTKFVYGDGFEITVGNDIPAGTITVDRDGKVVLNPAENGVWKFQQDSTGTKVYAADLGVTLGPLESATATATVMRAQVQVPYTITVKTKSGGVEAQTTGVFAGTLSWNPEYTVDVFPAGGAPAPSTGKSA